MPDDARTVPVTLDVDPDTAAALQDPATRARVGRLLGGLVRSGAAERPASALEAPKVDTPADDPGRGAEPDDLVERFRAFAAQHTLGGLSVKDLISEGRR